MRMSPSSVRRPVLVWPRIPKDTGVVAAGVRDWMVWAEPLSTSFRSAGVRFLTGLPFSSTTVTGRVMAPTAEATPGPEAGFWSGGWALGGVVWAGAAFWAVAGNNPV